MLSGGREREEAPVTPAPLWAATPVLRRPRGLAIESVDFPVEQTWFSTTADTPSLWDLR